MTLVLLFIGSLSVPVHLRLTENMLFHPFPLISDRMWVELTFHFNISGLVFFFPYYCSF